MTIMPNDQENDKAFEDSFEKFFKRFKINDTLRSINVTKQKGVLVSVLFGFIMKLVFTQKNFYTTFSSEREGLSFGKDAVYRFMSEPSARWEELIPKVLCKVIPIIDDLTSNERRSVLIIDDTPYYRDRSKKVELLSRFKDHSENRWYKGFNMLNLGWSDGVSFVPVDFRILASNNSECLLEGSHIKEDNRTIATRRRKQALTPKPELALQMLENVKGTPAQTKHVLFDSWFSPPKAILDIKRLGYDVVARVRACIQKRFNKV